MILVDTSWVNVQSMYIALSHCNALQCLVGSASAALLQLRWQLQLLPLHVTDACFASCVSACCCLCMAFHHQPSSSGTADAHLLAQPVVAACRMTRRQMLQVWQVVLQNTTQVAFKEANPKADLRPPRARRIYPNTHYFECFLNGEETPFHCPPNFNKSGAVSTTTNLPTFNPTAADFASCSQIGSHSCTLR